MGKLTKSCIISIVILLGGVVAVFGNVSPSEQCVTYTERTEFVIWKLSNSHLSDKFNWLGYKWEVVCVEGDSLFQAKTYSNSIELKDSIYTIFCKEYDEPMYENAHVPYEWDEVHNDVIFPKDYMDHYGCYISWLDIHKKYFFNMWYRAEDKEMNILYYKTTEFL